jgi:hypothetical protein
MRAGRRYRKCVAPIGNTAIFIAPPPDEGRRSIIRLMLRRLLARLKRGGRPTTDRELAEEEALRLQAEQERKRAESELAQQRQRIDSGGGGPGAGFGGW